MTALVASAILCAGCSSSEEPAPAAPEPFICEPTSPSPQDAFASERAPSSDDVALAQSIADRYMAEHPTDKIAWDWGEGTLMLGMVDLYRVTGETRFRDYYRAWIDRHIARGYQITMSDRCPPALSAMALYEETCDARYAQVVADVLEYLYEVAPRTEHGGISHLGLLDIFGPTLWVDSLFMFGTVLTRWGELTGDSRALDEYSNQIRIFSELLQEDSGLFMHAYNWPEQTSGIYWARGNSWVTAAGYEYLRVRKVRGESDPVAEQALSRQVAGLASLQDPDTGLWWTIMNRPGQFYLETSATALFALGLSRAMRGGFLGDEFIPVVQKAMAGVRTRIVLDEHGRPIVTGISGPTTVSTEQFYGKVPLEDDVSYGVGAVILALLEVSGL